LELFFLLLLLLRACFSAASFAALFKYFNGVLPPLLPLLRPPEDCGSGADWFPAFALLLFSAVVCIGVKELIVL